MAKQQVSEKAAEAPKGAPIDPVFYLDANLEIQNIEDVRRDLVEMLARALPVTVDVSRITSIDTAGVQLLLALGNSALKHGASVEFRGESAALSNALAVLGLQGAIPLAPRHAGR
ncbi:MAG: STAS domain-containing protein [Steroidobacteraceae bacterium]|jgi:ABC-type transporter Mla MlaB component